GSPPPCAPANLDTLGGHICTVADAGGFPQWGGNVFPGHSGEGDLSRPHPLPFSARTSHDHPAIIHSSRATGHRPTAGVARTGVMRPRLKRALRRIDRDARTIQFGVHPAQAVVLGDVEPAVRRLIDSLDGTSTLEQAIAESELTE